MTKEILTQNGHTILVSDARFEFLNQYHWYGVGYGDRIYAKTTINGRKTYMHRLILPDALEIDHINRNGLDNRDENLREATRCQNMANMPKVHMGTSSIYKGVSFDKWSKKWVASITINYKKKNLGRFLDEEDAARAYNEKALEYFGQFAILNEVINDNSLDRENRN